MSQDTLSIKLKVNEHLFQSWNNNPQALLLHPNFDVVSLTDFVLEHLQDWEGAPELNDLSISKWSFDAAHFLGKFRVNFLINRRYCCSDQQSCKNDYMDFTFRYHDQVFVATAEYFDWNVSI